MKQFVEDQKLVNMAVPTARLSHNQARLRRVLVSRTAARADKKPLTVQGAFKLMKKNSVIASAGVAGMLAVTIFTFSVVTPAHSVSAMQLAQDSSSAWQGVLTEANAKDMSPELQAYKKYSARFAEFLSKAQKAPDLRVLTYDQVLAAYPGANSPDSNDALLVVDNPFDDQETDVHTLKYLEFTLNDGGSQYKVLVGINQGDVPEATLMHPLAFGEVRG